MLVLHTSDWHLGRSFHGADLTGAQAAVLDHLVDVVREERVGLVLIAGDLYDRALPPVSAVELWGDTAERLVDAGAQVVVISGNHDSARRLGGGAGLLERAGVHIRTDPSRAADPVLLDLDGAALAVYPIPYLEPSVAADLVEGARPTHATVLRAAAERCRFDLAGRSGVRGIAVAHAFVAGGEECASERALTVGGAAQVSAGTFAGFDYVALGHLHGRQVLGEGQLRYSGSPLAYSFSEARHHKGAWLLDIGTDGVRRVHEVDLPVPRRLARLRGTLEDLLAAPVYSEVEGSWVSVTLTDTRCPAGAMPRLQRRFPHAVELTWEPAGGVVDLTGSYTARVAQRDDLEVVGEFVRHVRNTPADAEEATVLHDAVEAATRTPVEV
jgi:exonuclease SbcD